MSTRGGWESRAEWAGLASDFANRVLVRQIALGAAATIGVMLLAPWMLLLDVQGIGFVWIRIAVTGAAGVLTAALLGLQRLRASRAVLQALALEPDRVEALHVGLIADVPFALSVRFVLAFGVASALMALPGGERGGGLDVARGTSLGLLAFATFAAAGIVHFVLVREETIRAIELGPVEAISGWLEQESVRTTPQRRVVRKMLLAIALPVAVVGLGSCLVVRAHARAAAESARTILAHEVARAALDPEGPARAGTGRDDAIEAAAAFGIQVQRGALSAREEIEGLRSATEVRGEFGDAEGGTFVVRFGSERAEDGLARVALIALAAVLLAAGAGVAVGRTLADDLVRASRRIAGLSTESVLRGESLSAIGARFAAVAEVESSVDELSERFREFAAAQKRALEAKATAQRVKHLLFASVSHDLKSPLNAILGFCELLRDEHLSAGQEESLDMIEGRGRELLAMIETILDASRVEAGQLKLAPEPTPASELIERALQKAFDLVGERRAEVAVEIAQNLPNLHADRERGAGALAVFLAHAMSEAASTKDAVVQVRVTGPSAKSPSPRIHIEHASSRTRASHLEHQLAGRSPDQSARGTALRLSLARAVVELHGGRIEIGHGPRREAVVSCAWPATQRPRREEAPRG